MKKVDAVLVTVTAYTRADLDLDDHFESRGVTESGYRQYRVAHGRIELADAEDRQSALQELLDRAEQDIRASSVEADDDFSVDIHLTLLPHSGQAGIVLTSELLEAWASWNLSVYLDSLRS